MANILVVYDSGYGATRDAAETIKTSLAGKGLNVDLSQVGYKDPVGYEFSMFALPVIQHGDYLNQAAIRDWAENISHFSR